MASLALLPFLFAIQTPDTTRAFDEYVRLSEERMSRDVSARRFLPIGPEQRSRLRAGDIVIEPRRTLEGGQEIAVPGGLVQDWLGRMYIPGTLLAKVRGTMQDYDAYKDFYRPDVVESKVIAHNGDDYDIFLRLYKRQIITAVLNSTYHVHYAEPDPAHLVVISRSTRIAEVKNPKKSVTAEEAPGHGLGLLWALNSYWRFEEADGGVYAQLEAISLSRDIPFGLGWIKGFLQSFPKDSMQNTLEGTRRAVEQRR